MLHKASRPPGPRASHGLNCALTHLPGRCEISVGWAHLLWFISASRHLNEERAERLHRTSPSPPFSPLTLPPRSAPGRVPGTPALFLPGGARYGGTPSASGSLRDQGLLELPLLLYFQEFPTLVVKPAITEKQMM